MNEVFEFKNVLLHQYVFTIRVCGLHVTAVGKRGNYVKCTLNVI